MENNELAPKKQYSIEDFKAFNYVFHGKRDTDVKIFNKNKRITKGDIVELNRKITTKLEKENVVTNLFSLNLVLSDGVVKEYANWEVFWSEDLDIKELTKYLTIEYDFSVQLPLYPLPQRHTLKLRIGGAIGFDEFIKYTFSGGKESHEIEELVADVVCKVDFINFHLSNELKNIVKEWYEALPNNKTSNLLVRIGKRHFKKIEELFKIMFLSIGCLLLYYFVKRFYLLPSINSVDHILFFDGLYKILLVSFIVIYFFFTAGNLFADRILNKGLRKLKPNPTLSITKGDENEIKEIDKTNLKTILTIIFQIVLGIIANGFTYLIGELLTKK